MPQLLELIDGMVPEQVSYIHSSRSSYLGEIYFQKAAITRHSYFLQTFKLGHKILLTCEAEGHPTPSITWYKDGAEMHVYHTIYLSQTRLQDYKVRARLEIDPAAIGDEGVYSCLASNRHGYDLKSIKAIYYY
ncbi:unnamed protein product [Toxocara canis]|uniref:Ig-like domain-containing protein n=1 Tax=Toxocara canis TaxID=6265 RepID=A0A183V254_TOXCA|nr:unnamed protein product [Toxocara canis]